MSIHRANSHPNDHILSDMDSFDNVIKLLNSGSENQVANGMALFSKIPFEERCGIYDALYRQIPFTNTYWGCAEHAFHDQKGLRTTPEQKAQAIESYLSRLVSAVIFNSTDQSTIAKVTHFIFGKCVDFFRNGSAEKAMELFNKMPGEQKEGVYEELSKNHTHQGCAKDVFYEQSFTSEQKAQVIENYLIQNIADLLKSGDEKSAQTGLSLFNRMPKEQRGGIFGELYKLHAHTHDYWGCAEDVFYDRKGQSSTLLQKAQAIQNYLTHKRPALPTPIHVVKDLIQPSAKEQELGRLKAQEQREQRYRELDALRKSQNIKSLEQNCITIPEHYHSVPILNVGECLIRRASTHNEKFPNYTLIFRLPSSNKNDIIWITLDDKTGDILNADFSFSTFSELLMNYGVKPITEFPVQIQQDFIEEIEKLPATEFPIQIQQDSIEDSVEDIEKRFAAEFRLMQEKILIVDELKLSQEEVAFEKSQAEELFALGKRSIISENFISKLPIYKNGKLEIGENLYSLVTSGTQNFSTTFLASCGSSLREILLLDPNNSPVLAKHYDEFRKTLNSQMTTKQVLEMLIHYVQKEIFPSWNDVSIQAKTTEMLENARTTYPTTTHPHWYWMKIPIIPIDDFIRSDAGVCRHHALVSVYLLDRLLTESDPLIEGTVQHIRGNLDGHVEGAHIWATFIPKLKSGDCVEKWHLDTFWGRLANFADDKDLEKLVIDYGKVMMADQIIRTNQAAEKNGQTY